MTCPFSTTVIYNRKLFVALSAGKAVKMEATLLITMKGMWG